MLIYSHDTFGLGHLQRCLKIAERLVARLPRLSILLVTGSPVVHRFTLPPGVDYLKLPAVRKVGPEKYEARSMGIPYQLILELRANLLTQAVQNFAPHILLVDHSPAGMRGEMLPALHWLRASGRPCTKILGLRDIVDDPETVRKLWHDEGIYELMRTVYDRILVYGPREVFDLAAEYDFSPDLVNKTTYCNYVTDVHRNGIRASATNETTRPTKRVVVTIGGGDGAVDLIIGNYLSMVEKYRSEIDFESSIITGPFVAEDEFRQLQRRGRRVGVTVRSFVKSTSPYFRKSDLVVSTGGYNTVTQILCHARRALIIPRTMYRHEQLLRAACMARQGWVTMIPPEELTFDRLYREIRSLLMDSKQAMASLRSKQSHLLDGAAGVASVCEGILVAQSQEGRPL
ncbi:MAG: glycosyltransferase [Candidatus Zixiibacteriota bacterium]